MSKFIKVIPFIVIATIYYIFLPPINIQSYETWLFGAIIATAIIFAFINKHNSRRLGGYLFLPILIFVIFLGVTTAISSPLFNSRKYSRLIQPEQKTFEKDFKLEDINSIPLLDKDSAQRIGNRKLGELSSLVSQFDIEDSYTQINIKNTPYRISPLKYAGIIKWINNHAQGIGYYIKIDMTNGKTQLVKLEKPIKYSHADLFFRDIERHVRFAYPTKMTDGSHLEIDDKGVPYYVTPVIKKKIFMKASDVKGVILTNANSGKMKYYELNNIPQWIDRIHSASRVDYQIACNGSYKLGFLNSKFGKKGVVKPTEGYNYLAINDDVYYYSGITSVNSDNSSLGFNLVNLRTKEATFYKISVATEVSAMESAEGSVQEKEYKATFPILLKINNKPYYILSLKDNAGLIKSYSLIDAQDYQSVYTEKSLNLLFKSFMNSEDIIDKGEDSKLTITIEDIKPVVKNGNSLYYILYNNEVYQADIKVNDKLPFLKAQDKIEAKINGKKVKEFKIIK